MTEKADDKRFNETLKRMLATPPHPQNKSKVSKATPKKNRGKENKPGPKNLS